jgi:hypothetical protein
MPRLLNRKVNFLVLSVILFAIGLLLSFSWQETERYKEHYIQNFEEYLTSNKTATGLCWESFLESGFSPDSLASPNSAVVLVWQQDSLIYWTSNQVFPSPTQMASFDSLSRIILLKNGWYQGLKLKEGEFVGVFLYPIKTQYPFTNTYLKNRFVDKLDIPADVRLYNLEEESEFIDFIIYESGRELVGIQLGTTRPIPSSVVWSVVLIFSSILIFLVWWWVYIKSRFRLRKRLSILVFSIGVAIIRLGLFLLDFPGEIGI